MQNSEFEYRFKDTIVNHINRYSFMKYVMEKNWYNLDTYRFYLLDSIFIEPNGEIAQQEPNDECKQFYLRCLYHRIPIEKAEAKIFFEYMDALRHGIEPPENYIHMKNEK